MGCGPRDSVPACSDVQILKQLPRAQRRVMALKQGSNKRVAIKGFQMKVIVCDLQDRTNSVGPWL